ncbi:phospholipid P-type ATPase transporter [Xylona heveae TC161]|uniref:Phospholipid-transporting ATPase n=1 Tax=Xylona heveae (strain CBS 132557 / TC161) TaxID=1328760 RepID=A0A165JSQ7_XYLHT|nr:phospholipid P-type ATPase transporter [Xylona heveae TC161]KZF26576.1 phospholipid P-type ATPase transporter [Xylona heveae TC161]
MVGTQDEAGSTAGVRRRHSTQYDDDPTTLREVRPTTDEVSNLDAQTSPQAVVSSTTSGIESRRSSMPAGTEPAPRVRFSEDTPRALHRTRVSEGSAMPMRAAGISSASGAGMPGRPRAPSLSIDTTLASSRPGGNNQQMRMSPVAVTSPTSPLTGPSHVSPVVSPSSPRTRTRGYSLRRSLFARGINNQVERGGSVVEMTPVGPSAGPLPAVNPAGVDQSHKRKSSGTSISVSPLPNLDEIPPKMSPPNGGAKISALPHYESWVKRRASRLGFIHKTKAAYEKARKTILRINELPPSKDGRHIPLDPMRKKALTDERTGRGYVANTVRSCRYTIYSFVPRQLFAQFSKLANFYFLCVSILQMIPGLSTTGTYTTIVPLLFFVSISMAKEGFDDLRRYRLDKAENDRDAAVLHVYRPTLTDPEQGEAASPTAPGPKHWAPTKWKDIQVGDIIKLERDDAVPADIVLLNADGPNSMAYVETMALDGETNLKSKQATAALAKRCKSVDELAACTAQFVVEDPNLDLYNFEGRVTIDGETHPLTNSEIVYRGSILRNTPEAVGIVIYTGEECKIRMNATKNPRIKAPALQARVNRIVIIIVIFVIVLAIFNTVAYQIWSNNVEDKSWYLTNADVSFFPILTSFIIMFNTMIPLSLYVSLEIVKLAQMFLMNDVDMYDDVSNTPMEARTSTINEELGQVSYLFSDKTGTLTENTMRFRKMSVAGTAWLHETDIQREAVAQAERQKQQLQRRRSKGKKAAKRRSIVSLSSAAPRPSNLSSSKPALARQTEYDGEEPPSATWKSTARPSKHQPELSTTQLLRYLQYKPHTVFARKARFFLLSIALCHTCVPETDEDGNIDFQAASPDELALVRAAQEMGFLVIDRQVGTITLKSFPRGREDEPNLEVYEILDVIEFSSKRKRMSIIVRFPNHRICLFCKGADSIVMGLLRQSSLATEKAVEIERRASIRKSIEAEQAIRRNSEQISRSNSVSRPSITLGRTSLSGIGRPSMTGNRLQPIRDEIDTWLRSREQDVDISSVEDDSAFYSPRPSAQYGGRRSMAISEPRSSFQGEFDEELVEEALVVDDHAVFERCFQHINDFATEGLRTLMYGYRYIDEQEYKVWKKGYLEATTSLVDRQEMIERAANIIENRLELAGATAIEDKLQKGVPEAIDKLRRAGIKMWMLTGDKRETAINIGHSCRLIKDYSSVTVLDHEDGHIQQHIASAIIEVNKGSVAHSVVVVDGQTLTIIGLDETTQSLFYDLAMAVDSVICCRASPSQKASLVSAIRTKVKGSITLAIGDGANDIAMIQEAHVGIGITGKEGLQAARTSDYSIAQFRFLLKLLLVHGRWNYIRTCKYTLGTFWKEMLFYLTQALYQRWAGYTGTSLYESWSLSMFNTLFTSLPVIFLGIFEKDLAASTLLAVPELYNKGQQSKGFNLRVYLGWMFMASSEAMVIYFLMLGLFGQPWFTKDNGLFAMGDLTFTACIIIIASKMQLLEVYNRSVMVIVSLLLSIGGWFLWNIILTETYSKNNIYNVKDGILKRFGRDGLWWLTLLLIVVSCFALEIAVTALRSAYFPTDVDVFQECEKDPAIRRRFEEAAALELQQSLESQRKAFSVELDQEAQREGEIQELLDRPRVMEEGRASASATPPPDARMSVDVAATAYQSPEAIGATAVNGSSAARRSMDTNELLLRRFGPAKND